MSDRINFVPKIDKIWEAILYLVHKRPHTDHYTIVKLMYLADREHFRRHGRPISFDRYQALPYGPVPSNTLALLKRAAGQQGGHAALLAMGIADVPFEVTSLEKNHVFHSPKRKPNFRKFSRSDLKVLDETVAEHGDKTFYELYQITHAHFAYSNAWQHRKKGAKSAAIAYEDMLEPGAIRARQIEDISFVAPHV